MATAPTVASIAKEAFDAVAVDISGVIHTATLTRILSGTYDPATGTPTPGAAQDAGRGLFASVDAARDIFPELIVGPADELIYLEGITTLAPKETDKLVMNNRTLAVLASRDLLGSGGLYAVLAR